MNNPNEEKNDKNKIKEIIGKETLSFLWSIVILYIVSISTNISENMPKALSKFDASIHGISVVLLFLSPVLILLLIKIENLLCKSFRDDLHAKLKEENISGLFGIINFYINGLPPRVEVFGFFFIFFSVLMERIGAVFFGILVIFVNLSLINSQYSVLEIIGALFSFIIFNSYLLLSNKNDSELSSCCYILFIAVFLLSVIMFIDGLFIKLITIVFLILDIWIKYMSYKVTKKIV